MSPIVVPAEPFAIEQAPASDVGIPHFTYPFQFQTVNGQIGAAITEQDTLEEVFGCVQAIVACPIGFRDELPPFGIAQPEFAATPIDPTNIQHQVGLWESRADTTALEYADIVSDAIRHVQLGVSLNDVPPTQ